MKQLTKIGILLCLLAASCGLFFANFEKMTYEFHNGPMLVTEDLSLKLNLGILIEPDMYKKLNIGPLSISGFKIFGKNASNEFIRTLVFRESGGTYCMIAEALKPGPKTADGEIFLQSQNMAKSVNLSLIEVNKQLDFRYFSEISSRVSDKQLKLKNINQLADKAYKSSNLKQHVKAIKQEFSSLERGEIVPIIPF